MRDMSQGGVGVGTMSHKCGRYESGWSRCGNDESQVWEEKEKSPCEACVNCNITPLLTLKFLLKI